MKSSEWHSRRSATNSQQTRGETIKREELSSSRELSTCLPRQKTYAKGGIVSVTSRILVVDMLNKKLPIHLVSGIVVLHAEKCATVVGLFWCRF
jgi:hypothetical protein